MNELSLGLRADYKSPNGETEVHHHDGIPWFDSPRPNRFHRCKAQTDGWFNYLTRVERCACGAIRYDGKRGVWMERNSRKAKP